MRTIKFLLLLLSMVVYLILGLLVRLILTGTNPCITIKAVNHLTYYLMHVFTAIGGLRISVSGHTDILKEKSLFIISTHVGYLDAIILGTLLPGSFVTKSDVKQTPFLGKVVSIGDSIFINRKKKNNVVDYIKIMTKRLKNGISIFNFPEGHATDGSKILPFFTAFFDAPLKTKSAIVPITIDYVKVNGKPDFNRNEIYYYGERTSIIKHLWNLMKFKSIDAAVTVHEKIPFNGHQANSQDRKRISELCMQRLSRYKNLPVCL